jgi:putative endonuclease
MKNKQTYKLGLFGEFIAVIFLRIKFYSILKTRYKNNFGEIDIICKKGKSLIAVEVKTRNKNFEIGEIITENQKRRVVNSMANFVSKNQKYVDYNVRFDVIAIRPFRIPLHLQNCWEGK